MQRTTLILAIAGIALNVQIICGIPLTTPKATHQCPYPDDCYKTAYKKMIACTQQSDCDGFGLLELGCCPHRCGPNEKYVKVCTHLERVPAPTPIKTEAITSIKTTEKPNIICDESNPKDILFVVDGSVNRQQHWKETEKQFEELKKFLKQVISGLKPGEKFRIGVMQFGGRSDPKMEIKFSDKTNMAQLLSRVDLIKQRQGVERMTGEALATSSNKLYEMNTIYDRYNAQDIIVLITRGDAWDREQVQSEIEMLQRKHVGVIIIGVNPHPKRIKSYLTKFVSSPRDLYLTNYKNLGDRKDAVLQGICSNPIRAAVVSSCQNRKYDIFFVIDGSASINYKNFEKKRKLLMDLLVSLFPDETADVHIGLMQFSEQNETEQLLQIGKHSLKAGLNVVERMQYQSGEKTMLGDALSNIDKKVFNGRGGDRLHVKDILVIFSDGQAHDLSKALSQAENIKNKGVRVITISVRADGNLNELSKMASKQKYSLSVKLTDASYYAQEIASLICQSD